MRRESPMDQYGYTTGGQGRKQVEHQITMRGRKTLEITGVKHVESFDNEEFLLETNMGFLSIRGQHLQMKNLMLIKAMCPYKEELTTLFT